MADLTIDDLTEMMVLLDKDGNRIDSRNAQDIFTPLYNNKGQLSGSLPIPPDAGTSTASFLWHCPPQSLPAFPAGFLLQPDVSATLR
jgi:hypothetical protein